ncbi:hypothetical protein AKJ51_04465 [candidate division MSBL1 archaeon SCGC-AAA382A20]|uniref:Uncharacterized protein n=1 Tax=candidate division MSBL1 archaeon SCGC-AAA382A20 TaxID=1698280 RepID=A0A133VHP2_9EURY|nr:hypothetical protein AKJ51_04465 [candidate division MSBL1 archaeon SCGC-AAA382A20]
MKKKKRLSSVYIITERRGNVKDLFEKLGLSRVKLITGALTFETFLAKLKMVEMGRQNPGKDVI